jgi:hypothetical protein
MRLHQFERYRYGISPPHILASGQGRCRDAGSAAFRVRAILSVAAGALDCSVHARGFCRLARLIGQFLSERLGQQFIIEPGPAVNVGAEVVAKAPPDGHTLLVVAANNTINATLYDKLPFDFIRDIAPVANMVRTPLVMLVSPSFPEFIAMPGPTPKNSSWLRVVMAPSLI